MWTFEVLLLSIAGCAKADVTGIHSANHMIAQVMNMLKQADPADGDVLDERMPHTVTFDYDQGSLVEQVAPIVSNMIGGTSKAINPLKMVADIGNSCHDVPELMKQSLGGTHCSATAEEWLSVIKGMATMYIDITTGQPGVLPPETERVWERLSRRQCEEPACHSLMEKVIKHGIECEVTTICALESAVMPADKCRSLLHDVLSRAVQIQSMCDREPSTGELSNMVLLRLMSENPVCYLELSKVNEGCSPDCRHWWLKQRRRYPHSSMLLATQISQSSIMGQKLANQLAGPLAGPSRPRIAMRSPDEMCADLGIAASFQV